MSPTEVVRAGHGYGNFYNFGTAPVHLGDNLHDAQSSAQVQAVTIEKVELRKALYYNKMDLRRAQLAASEKASLEWIWDTALSPWLASDTRLFWINGKPGSGKSTLMQHLSLATNTKRLLSQTGRRWRIIDFYFDFRAGSGIANTPLGMFRSLLKQLIEHCTEADAFVRRRHRDHLDGPWLENETEVLTTLCLALDQIKDATCLFIDGLDEYNGKHEQLLRSLFKISNHGDLKICLASRPEPVIARLLSSTQSLRMQDHNSHTIEAYIHGACESMLTSDERKTMQALWKTVHSDSNGVILWARFVIDELITQTIAGATTRELEHTLKLYPREMDEVYDRIISKIPFEGTHRLSAAALFYVLDNFGFISGCNDSTYHIMVAWMMVLESLDSSISFDSSFEVSKFRARVHWLLGGLIEFNPVAMIRYVHKSLKTYLDNSKPFEKELLTLLASDFTARQYKNFDEQFWSCAIHEAHKSVSHSCTRVIQDGVTSDRQTKALAETTNTANEWNASLLTSDTVWKVLPVDPSDLADSLRTRLQFVNLSLVFFVTINFGRDYQSFWDLSQLPIASLHFLFCGSNVHCKQLRKAFPWTAAENKHYSETWHLWLLLAHERWDMLLYGLHQVIRNVSDEALDKLLEALKQLASGPDSRYTGNLKHPIIGAINSDFWTLPSQDSASMLVRRLGKKKVQYYFPDLPLHHVSDHEPSMPVESSWNDEGHVRSGNRSFWQCFRRSKRPKR